MVIMMSPSGGLIGWRGEEVGKCLSRENTKSNLDLHLVFVN